MELCNKSPNAADPWMQMQFLFPCYTLNRRHVPFSYLQVPTLFANAPVRGRSLPSRNNWLSTVIAILCKIGSDLRLAGCRREAGRDTDQQQDKERIGIGLMQPTNEPSCGSYREEMCGIYVLHWSAELANVPITPILWYTLHFHYNWIWFIGQRWQISYVHQRKVN